MKTGVLALLALMVVNAAAAQNVVVSLMTPLDPAAPGGEVRVDLVVLNPTHAPVTYATPRTLAARLERGSRSWPVELRGQADGGAVIAAGGFSYRPFTFTVPAGATGRLVLEVERPLPARAVLDVRAPAESVAVAAPLSATLPGQTVETAIQRSFAGRFSAHEPVYFIYGPRAPGAKFQFSFKYRLLGDQGELGEKLPELRGLYFGFTQRSLWNIQAASSPFYDTSYMPELIYESQALVKPGTGGGFHWLGFQAGVRHESNGRDGADSRSLNIVYVRPGVAFGRLDGWSLILAPRVFAYIGGLSDNPDLGDYRGNLELLVVAGRNDGLALALTGRAGYGARKGSLQADLTIPLKSRRFFDFATYLLIQYWNGYGESLLGYNKQSSTVRAGFSLVR